MDNTPEDLGDMVITTEVFDDIHLGHKCLIAAAVSDARARGVKSPLITFSPSPVTLSALGKVPPTLPTVLRRVEPAGAEEINVILVVPFDRTFSSIPAEDSVRTVVRGELNAQAVFVSQNFIYSQKASSTAETLPGHGRKCGVDVTIVDLPDVAATDPTERVSPMRIYGLLADGAASAATSCLEYFHRVDDDIIPGRGHGGAQLGFPTASIGFVEGPAIPADDVYAAWFTVQPTAARPELNLKDDTEFGVHYPTAVSMDTNVTFGDTNQAVEAYVIDRHVDLYGTAGQVEFVGRTRGMEKFDSIEELIDRMNQNVADTEAILTKAD